LPELEDQTFPSSVAFAEGFFHLVVTLEVDEVAVGTPVYRPAPDPDLVLALHEIAILAKRDVWRSTQPQILVVEVWARNDAPSTVEVQFPYSVSRDFFHANEVLGSYKVGFAAGSLLHSVAKILRVIYPP
jgi:hypothetical protein